MGVSEDQAQARRVCVAAYVSFKLMDEVLFGLIDIWLVTSRHPERSAFVRMSADLDSLKIVHLLLTFALPLLLRPFRLQVLFLVTSFLFAFNFLMAATSLAGGQQLVSTNFYVCGVVLTLCMLATDAVADAICRSMKVYLQPVRKLAALLCTVCILAQVHLPSSFRLVPLACLFALALGSGLYAAVQARRLSLRGGALDNATSMQYRTMTPGGALLFSSSVLVGDNGEEILDVITNYKIAEQLAGGSTFGFDVKHGINLISHTVNGFLFWKRYNRRFVELEDKQKDNKADTEKGVRYEVFWSLGVLAVWAVFQVCRLIAWAGSSSPSQSVVAGLILGDKLIGSAAQDAMGFIQGAAVVEMSTATAGTLVATGFGLSPNLASSLSEVCKKLSKAWLKKSLLDETHWVRENSMYLVGACVVLAMLGHLLMSKIILRAKVKTS